MKIATFNANSIRSRLDIILSWLEENRPDHLCIQETKVQDSQFPAAVFEHAGYPAVFRGEKAYNGVAILSRQKPDEVMFGLDDGGPPDEARLACARFGAMRLLTSYVPQGRDLNHDMFTYKLEWFRRLNAYFSRHFKPGDAVVWTGDLNVAAAPEDVHHPETKQDHVCYHESVRQAFADCRAWGFADLYRLKHPDQTEFTFFDYRVPHAAERGMGWRLDYILGTEPMARRCTDVCVDMAPRRKPKPSDHTFLMAEFSDEPAE